jgi:hypothetical protein
MKLAGKTLSRLFGLALLAVLGAGGYLALKFGLELFASMAPQVAAMTTIGSIVVLLVALVIARSIRQASKQDRVNQLYADKAATFQHFIDLWGDLCRHGHDSEDRNLDDLSKELLALDRQLILSAASSVIRAHAELRVLMEGNGPQHPEMRFRFARALIDIRNDLGLDTHDLTAEELQQLLFSGSDRVNAFTAARAYQDLPPRVSLASTSREGWEHANNAYHDPAASN